MMRGTDLHLEIETIDPDSDWIVLDRTYIDAEEVLAPDDFATHVDGTFILDESVLDLGILESWVITQPGYVWQDLTCESTYISIKRGVDLQRGLQWGRPYAGILEAKVYDPYLDALANQYVGLGNKVRVRVAGDVVFTGHTTRLYTNYDATGVPVLSLRAVDGVARLNSVTMPERSSESYGDRMEAAGDAAGLGVLADTGGTYPNTKSMTALELLGATQDSEGSFVWIDRYNRLNALEWSNDPVPLSPKRTNLFSNPSFGVSLDGWESAQTKMRWTGTAHLGYGCMAAVCSSADSNLAYSVFTADTAGDYIVSAYFSCDGGSIAGQYIWIQGEGGTATYTNGVRADATLGTGWTRASRIVNVTVPGTVLMVFRLGSAPSGFTDQRVYIDNAMAEAGSTLLPYFDGSTTNGVERGEWTGDEDLSTSVYMTPDPVFIFSDTGHGTPKHVCITKIETSMDTEQVVNNLTLNNIEWNGTDWTTVAYNYADDASATYYGVRARTTTTTLDTDDLAGSAAYIFEHMNTAVRKTRTVNFVVDHMEDDTINDIAYIDIGDVVQVYLDNVEGTALTDITENRRVAEIDHRITPTIWDCQITLA